MYRKFIWLATFSLLLPACAPRFLYTDDFSTTRNGWTTGTSDSAGVDYVGGEYVINMKEADWFIWGVPQRSDFSNIHLEVTAKPLTTTLDVGFGLICGYQDGQNFYYLGLDPNSYFAIAKFVADQPTMLSDERVWIQSPDITPAQESYRVGADCGHGQLTLYVNGKAIKTVLDASLTKGQVGVFVNTTDTAPTEVHFDDFQVTELPKP